MSNKLFVVKNGMSFDLPDEMTWEQMKAFKDRVERVFDTKTLWVVKYFRPVFDSRGKYLGYTQWQDFKEV